MEPEELSERLYPGLEASVVEAVNMDDPVRIYLPQCNTHLLEETLQNLQQRHSKAVFESSLRYADQTITIPLRHGRSVIDSFASHRRVHPEITSRFGKAIHTDTNDYIELDAVERSFDRWIVQQRAGPTQVKELTAEPAADPSTFDGRELPKQSALKPKYLFSPTEGPPEDQPESWKDTRQSDKKRKSISDQRLEYKPPEVKKLSQATCDYI
ncbi:hypothetical protein AgCh_027992 [Apium graveolens]